MRSKTRKSSNVAALISASAIILILGVTVPARAQYDIYDLGFPVRAQDIRADNNNTVHIAWVDWGVLYYGKIVNNAITGQEQVATGVEIAMWRPFLSVRPDGYSVHVAWTTSGQGNMLMHSWKTTGGWANEHLLTVPSTQKLSQATCAVDSSGIVHVMFVIWNNVPGNDWATVFYMRRLANGQWEPMERFIPYSVEYKHPMLVNDSQGRVHATWTLQGRYGSDRFDAYYCMAPSGGKLSYTNMMKIPKAAGSDVNGYGELYVDHNGVVHRSIGGWSEALQKMCLDHAKKPVGAGFEIPTRASIGFLNVAMDPYPAVVASEDGKAIVAWGEIGVDGSNTVKASFYDPGKGTWSLNTVDPAAGIPAGPYSYRVALTRTDTQAFLAWRGSNGNLKLLVVQYGGTGKKDFNRDGQEDILWRYYGSGGYNAIWYMNGATRAGSTYLPSTTDLNWKIAGIGDFNRDGWPDILWRNYGSGGDNKIWYMNGATLTESVSLPSITDLNWQIAGTGDFNRDGWPDILWRYYGSGGYNAIWYMNGATRTESVYLPSITDLNWRIENH